jgi:hypothetical protein
MVVQLFASMHRDQMGMLQQELDHIHRITKELQELQAEAKVARDHAATRENGATRPAALPKPATPATPDRKPPRTRETTAQSGPANGNSRPAAEASKSPETRDVNDMHDWINQRIVNLQRERESRWQKVFSFVMGK